MIEEIKKLLDSGCLVEIKYKFRTFFGDQALNKMIGYGISRQGNIISLHNILYRGDDGEFYIYRPEIYAQRIEIVSIEPIGRPLYKYNKGDRVIVLDNYDGNKEDIGQQFIIDEIEYGNVALKDEREKIKRFDIRTIAPVL